jgi:hypothetical protein
MASGPPFHEGEAGVPYSVALSATGGVAPYTWSVSTGALPGGLMVNGDGLVSGTPAGPGSFAFTIQVADAGDSKATISGTIAIAPQLAVNVIPACVQYCRVELGCVDVCGAFGSQSGGVGPYEYNLVQGPLPAGTSLNQLSLAGTFKGLSGYLKFTVQVTDALGEGATISPTFWMYDHVSLAGGSIGASRQPTCWWTGYDPASAPGCRGQFPYSGGTTNAGTPSVSAAWTSYTNSCYTFPSPPPAKCSPPPMPSISVSGGVVTVTVGRGGGYWSNGYTGTLAVTLTNHDSCSAGPAACSATSNVTITQQAS